GPTTDTGTTAAPVSISCAPTNGARSIDVTSPSSASASWRARIDSGSFLRGQRRVATVWSLGSVRDDGGDGDDGQSRDGGGRRAGGRVRRACRRACGVACASGYDARAGCEGARDGTRAGGPEAEVDELVDELVESLARRGMTLEPGARGRVMERGLEVGRVVDWRRCERILLEWRHADWASEEVTEVEIRFAAAEAGTRV